MCISDGAARYSSQKLSSRVRPASGGIRKGSIFHELNPAPQLLTVLGVVQEVRGRDAVELADLAERRGVASYWVTGLLVVGQGSPFNFYTGGGQRRAALH